MAARTKGLVNIFYGGKRIETFSNRVVESVVPLTRQRRKYFGPGLKIRDNRIQEGGPQNLDKPGPMVEENKHADRKTSQTPNAFPICIYANMLNKNIFSFVTRKI